MNDPTAARRERADSFPCPACGGRMRFDPQTQQLKCPFCDTLREIPIVRTPPEEYPLDGAPVAQGDWGAAVRVIRCEGCGAKTVLEKNEGSSFCAFCGSPHVLEDQSEAGIAPESVLPFAITQSQAADGFRGWLRRRWFAPAKAKKMARLGQIAGVYLPHWTYDANSTSHYTGQAGHYYYVNVPVTVTRNGKAVTEMRRERRIRWEHAAGVVQNHFDDVLVAGSRRLDEELLSRVRPFDLASLVRYQGAFLSGFLSEKPSVDVQAAWHTAQGVIDERMRELAHADICRHADTSRVDSLQTENQNVRYKLTLLPMYLSSFLFKGKEYHVLVNGQSGRVGGQAPVSALRVCAAVALGVGLITLLYWLFTGDNAAAREISQFL